VDSLGGSENAIRYEAFSSQVAALGGSENAIKQPFNARPLSECAWGELGV
jgi:hypothetical protein